MQEKFEIVNFLDNCRWSKSENNYGLINYSRKNMTNDLKLLTHWISYITDRQMKFEIIWDVGGFVFSDMLYKYKYSKNGMDVLNPDYQGAFFIKKQDGEFTFISSLNASDNPTKNGKELLNKYGFNGDNRVRFVSRFYPADYISIFYTLHTLKTFDKDFISYIIYALEMAKSNNPKEIVKTFAYALYILTYEGIGQPSKNDLNYDELMNKAKNRTNQIIKTLNSKELLKNEIDSFYNRGTQFKIKRIWCCIRDYIKSDEFGKKCFKAELVKRKVDKKLIDSLFSYDAKSTIELPGDVWNNNEIFRKCLFKNLELTSKEEKMDLNKLLRQKYEQSNIKVGYPEQFDVTFDLVPRMCEKGNCDICPFGIYDKESIIEKICINDKNKYCTVAQICCGYRCECKPDKCVIKNYIRNKNKHKND